MTFKCDICENSYTRNSTLKRHKRITHNNDACKAIIPGTSKKIRTCMNAACAKVSLPKKVICYCNKNLYYLFFLMPLQVTLWACDVPENCQTVTGVQFTCTAALTLKKTRRASSVSNSDLPASLLLSSLLCLLCQN